MKPESKPLLLATRSAHKAAEIRAILGDIQLISLADAGLEPEPDEDHIEAFDTFGQNALAKATWFHRLSGLPTIADDSGICAAALDGRPGVRSRRFSGRLDLDGTDLDRANNRALIAALADRPGADRTVRYVCAAVLVAPGYPPLTTLGTVSGQLLPEPRGEGGFGYDPLFLLPPLRRTFAQLDPASKHRVSHRGSAFRALAVAIGP